MEVAVVEGVIPPEAVTWRLNLIITLAVSLETTISVGDHRRITTPTPVTSSLVVGLIVKHNFSKLKVGNWVDEDDSVDPV